MESRYLLCVRNDGYAASIEPRKVYQALPDPAAARNFVRVVNESGEDYLYPEDFFVRKRSGHAGRVAGRGVVL